MNGPDSASKDVGIQAIGPYQVDPDRFGGNGTRVGAGLDGGGSLGVCCSKADNVRPLIYVDCFERLERARLIHLRPPFD